MIELMLKSIKSSSIDFTLPEQHPQEKERATQMLVSHIADRDIT